MSERAIYEVLTKCDNIPIHIARDDWKQEGPQAEIVPHHQIKKVQKKNKLCILLCEIIQESDRKLQYPCIKHIKIKKKEIQLNSIHCDRKIYY